MLTATGGKVLGVGTASSQVAPSMEDSSAKRETFLRQLSDAAREEAARRFDRHAGSGLVKKVKRLVAAPTISIPYYLRRLGLPRGDGLEIKLFFGRKLRVYANDLDASMLATMGFPSGNPELRLTKFLIKKLQRHDVFYDIGANHGFYTYLAREFCKEVHAFEPLHGVFEGLKANLADDTGVFLNEVALSNREGFAIMHVDRQHTGGSTISESVYSLDPCRYDETPKIDVRTMTLDGYVGEHSKPTILKMDVEGAESFVIEGGREFFKYYSPIVAMEVWPAHSQGSLSWKALKTLLELNYTPHVIMPSGDLRRLDMHNPFPKTDTDNYVFVKQ